MLPKIVFLTSMFKKSDSKELRWVTFLHLIHENAEYFAQNETPIFSTNWISLNEGY